MLVKIYRIHATKFRSKLLWCKKFSKIHNSYNRIPRNCRCQNVSGEKNEIYQTLLFDFVSFINSIGVIIFDVLGVTCGNVFNPLSTNPTRWSNNTQTIRR